MNVRNFLVLCYKNDFLRSCLIGSLLALVLNISQANTPITNVIPQFHDAAQQARYDEIIRVIRCPTCQNQDIAESNAPLAQQLRTLIAEQIRSGKSTADITDYLIARYGDFITYEPRFQKKTWLLWLSPIIVMFIALFMLIRRRHQPQMLTLTTEQKNELRTWLDQYGGHDE